MSTTIGLPPNILSMKSSRTDSGYGPSYSSRKMSYGTASIAPSFSGSTVTSEDSLSPKSVAFPPVYVSAAQPMQEFVAYDDYAEEYAVIDDLYEIYGDEQDNEYIDAEFAFQRRETAIRDLYHTEHTYIKGLKLLRDVFLNSLKQQVKQQANRGGFLSGTKIICTDAEINLIFGNLEQILDVHDRMLKSLQERLQIWGPTQIISDIFLHLHPDLIMYNVYLKNYTTAVVTLERLNKTATFKKFVETSQEDPSLEGHTLMKLLQTPLHRIPQYKELLEALFKNTAPLHPDYHSLMRCVEQINLIANEVMERIQDAENHTKVLEIQNQLISMPIPLVAPNRRFFLRGDLFKVNASNASSVEPRTYFLFNDILIFAKIKDKNTFQYKGTIDLAATTVQPLDNNAQPHCFEMLTKTMDTQSSSSGDIFNRGPNTVITSHIVRAGSQSEREHWISTLNQCIEEVKEQQKLKQMTRKSAGSTLHPGSTLSPQRSMTQPLSRSTTQSSGGSTMSIDSGEDRKILPDGPLDLKQKPKKIQTYSAKPAIVPADMMGFMTIGNVGMRGV